MSSKVSFTIRRPTPVSRDTSSGPESDSSSSFKVPSVPRHLQLTNDSAPGTPSGRSTTSSPRPTRAFHYSNGASDDSGEEESLQDELVTSFDQFSVQRVYEERKRRQQNADSLVIPPLQDRDWRETARKRRGGTRFIPASAAVPTGADGSVGGLGTRDTIGAGPVQAGLHFTKKSPSDHRMDVDEHSTVMQTSEKTGNRETEDEKAMRALLASANGEINDRDATLIDIIPVPITPGTVTETEAFRQDVLDLPDVATLDDYARVPVSQFGAALMRGMGWKEGTAASLTRGGPVEPYLPEARPALLGLGAKAMEEGVAGIKGKKTQKYMPVIKKEREKGSGRDGDGESERERDREREMRNGSGRSSRRRTPDSRHGSNPGSRRTSKSPPRKDRGGDRDREGRAHEQDRDRDYERDRSRRGQEGEHEHDRARSRQRGNR